MIMPRNRCQCILLYSWRGHDKLMVCSGYGKLRVLTLTVREAVWYLVSGPPARAHLLQPPLASPSVVFCTVADIIPLSTSTGDPPIQRTQYGVHK